MFLVPGHVGTIHTPAALSGTFWQMTLLSFDAPEFGENSSKDQRRLFLQLPSAHPPPPTMRIYPQKYQPSKHFLQSLKLRHEGPTSPPLTSTSQQIFSGKECFLFLPKVTR